MIVRDRTRLIDKLSIKNTALGGVFGKEDIKMLGFSAFYNLSKGLRLVYRKFSKDLAVQLDVCGL